MFFKSKLIVAVATLYIYSVAAFAVVEGKGSEADSSKEEVSKEKRSKGVIYQHPLSIPVSLSGNFGEIRGSHFHSGVDLKTQGVEGHKLTSVADGYISRLFVSPTGYGKAIYITHPTLGTVSVYGHLKGFSPRLAEYVKAYQYRNKKFSANLYLPKDKFKVSQGDLIGYTGNSGSSGGPHLHFEIRDAATSETLDPLVVCGIKTSDSAPPKIVSVTVVELDYSYGIPIHTVKQKYNTTHMGGGKYIVRDTIKASKDCYFAFEVTEKKSNSSNIFGVSALNLRSSEREIWGYKIDRLSFSYGRAMYNMLLYPQTTKTRNDIIRTYVSPTNRLAIYSDATDDGVISLKDITEPTEFKLNATDEHGNNASLTFIALSSSAIYKTAPPKGELIFANKAFRHNTDDMRLYIPSFALQQSTYTSITSQRDGRYTLSNVVQFAKDEAPFSKKATLSIKVNNRANIPSSKLFITYISTQGKETSVGGVYKEGFVSTSVNGGGRYRVSADTISPKIIALQKRGATLKNSISFKISDDLSGINKYDIYIDDRWILFDYDAKRSKITGELDPTKITKGGKHSCKVVVSDNKGNKSTYNTTFIW